MENQLAIQNTVKIIFLFLFCAFIAPIGSQVPSDKPVPKTLQNTATNQPQSQCNVKSNIYDVKSYFIIPAIALVVLFLISITIKQFLRTPVQWMEYEYNRLDDKEKKLDYGMMHYLLKKVKKQYQYKKLHFKDVLFCATVTDYPFGKKLLTAIKNNEDVLGGVKKNIFSSRHETSLPTWIERIKGYISAGLIDPKRDVDETGNNLFYMLLDELKVPGKNFSEKAVPYGTEINGFHNLAKSFLNKFLFSTHCKHDYQDVRCEFLATFNYLLEKGVRVNPVSTDQRSPLVDIIAASEVLENQGYDVNSLIQAFLEHGANPKLLGESRENSLRFFSTPLHVVIALNKKTYAETLCDYMEKRVIYTIVGTIRTCYGENFVEHLAVMIIAYHGNPLFEINNGQGYLPMETSPGRASVTLVKFLEKAKTFDKKRLLDISQRDGGA